MSTKFQELVWRAIDTIPYGETRSYKDIAISIGKPNASRAVANACGKNPIPISRPCHRVICSNGSIGGYSAPGGVEKKKRLLKEEIKN
ncbi:MGMT family protein [Gammaproteobacteria bacterium]|jgi:O-6-methylguanine DNA methyltransferase|nr:MGMT family protein [Gammaproteobacteria bacterium]MDA9903715.1 MGMT family protein [Gammaproteobacteria bacterium]MDB4849245.1 MGMT family protein [Gammaproteobacteria bacterium]MDC0401569.1 MGMT family protein [Gammaproteobacteria bacterium]MDC1074538.1 MGMT family protein [Gammaproteobacteria bacterium]